MINYTDHLVESFHLWAKSYLSCWHDAWCFQLPMYYVSKLFWKLCWHNRPGSTTKDKDGISGQNKVFHWSINIGYCLNLAGVAMVWIKMGKPLQKWLWVNPLNKSKHCLALAICKISSWHPTSILSYNNALSFTLCISAMHSVHLCHVLCAFLCIALKAEL